MFTYYAHCVSCWSAEIALDMEAAPFAYWNFSACEVAEEESDGVVGTYSAELTEHEFPMNSTVWLVSASIDLGGT